jgi:DNA-binding NarL/FixJ family response regulator
LIADSSASIYDGTKRLSESYPDIDVVAWATSGDEVVRKCREIHPDVVILEPQTPGMNDVEMMRRMKQATPSVGILLFSVFSDCWEHISSGHAVAYVNKDAEPDKLIDAVRLAARAVGDRPTLSTKNC